MHGSKVVAVAHLSSTRRYEALLLPMGPQDLAVLILIDSIHELDVIDILAQQFRPMSFTLKLCFTQTVVLLNNSISLMYVFQTCLSCHLPADTYDENKIKGSVWIDQYSHKLYRRKSVKIIMIFISNPNPKSHNLI